MDYNSLMNDSTKKILNTKTGLLLILVLILLAIVIYFDSSHSGSPASVTTATSSLQTQTASTSSATVQTQGSGSVTLSPANQESYATYALKDPNRLPITQYPTAYGVELDFVATGSSLPSTLCLKVAADVPIKAFSIPNHPNASSTIPTTKYGGAFTGITCFSGGITSEEDTMVYFNTKPSQINSSLTTSNVL